MAAGAVMYTFAVQLADVDPGVYEDVELRAARHPPRPTRMYFLEYVEGITLSDGISSTEVHGPAEPAVLVRTSPAG